MDGSNPVTKHGKNMAPHISNLPTHDNEVLSSPQSIGVVTSATHARLRRRMLQRTKSAPNSNVHTGVNSNTQVSIQEQWPKDVICLGQKRTREFSDENINPQNRHVPQTESCGLSSSMPMVERIPLSPIPLGNTFNSNNGTQSTQLKSKKSNTGRKSTYKSTESFDVHSTQQLRHNAVLCPCDEDTTPQSQIINPSSVFCSSKSVVQPQSIIQTIPSIQFSNKENHANQVQSEEDTEIEFLSRLSGIASQSQATLNPATQARLRRRMLQKTKSANINNVHTAVSLEVPSTQPLHQPSASHPSDEETTPQSEIVNPSSMLSSSKSVVQPLSIIQSIPSIQFTSQEDYHQHIQTSTEDAWYKFLSNQSEIAESQEPLDLGDPSYVCGKCEAWMWYDERADKCTRSNPPEFSMCCMKGKVKIPFLMRPPPLLESLLNGQDHRSGNYKENVRLYNSMFSFTSIGGKVETSCNQGGGPPQFILSGQNYHRIGSLVPEEGSRPKFSQLYIYDTQNETASRVRSRKGLKILILDDEGMPCYTTTNVVYKEVFENL